MFPYVNGRESASAQGHATINTETTISVIRCGSMKNQASAAENETIKIPIKK